MKRAYPVVIERGPTLYGAYAPDVPGTFAAERTLPEARHRVRTTIARHLRLTEEMGDEIPEPDPKVARALARVTDPGSGLPVDPVFEVVTVEVGPEDAPPEALPEPAPTEPALPEAGRSEPWNETFVAVIGKTPENYCGDAPDLPVCVSVGDTMEAMRRNMAEAISLHVQSMVDDGDPLPERRLTPEEALRRYYDDPDVDPTNPEDAAVAERITVEIRPPRPQARVLNAIWRQACRNEEDFQKDCTVRSAVGPGESWRGAYAAEIFRVDGIWHGMIPDLAKCLEIGRTLEELRGRLQSAIADRLLEAVASEGAIPLPRRTADTAAARHNLDSAGEGADEFPDPDLTFEMIPVEIVAPAVACAS